jgi:hypothetical protein
MQRDLTRVVIGIFLALITRHVHQVNRPLASHSIASGPPGPKSILDGSLLSEFLDLSYAQQLELAKAVGSNIDRIMDDLLEISKAFKHF